MKNITAFLREGIWGILIGGLLLVLAQGLYIYQTGPKTPTPIREYVPYENARVINAEAYNDFTDGKVKIRIEATFDKLECEFGRLEVFALLTGYPTWIPWEPLENKPNAPEYDDKLAGVQILLIAVIPDGISFDALEIRTRHYCDVMYTDGTLQEDVHKDLTFATILYEDIENYVGYRDLIDQHTIEQQMLDQTQN